LLPNFCKMHDVYVSGENVITSLGFTIEENIENIRNDVTGVRLRGDKKLFPEDFFASIIDSQQLDREFHSPEHKPDFTRFEKIMICSAEKALAENTHIDASSEKTIFVISSTKGNIDLLEEDKKILFEPDRVYLWKSAEIIAEYFGNKNKPVVISNACVSGVLAISTASEMLRSGWYNHAVVIGGDIVTEFVVSGFQSFKSLSFGPCKPFDLNRDGLNLGEGAGTILMTTRKEALPKGAIIKVLGGACNNDANHISGPSRTGEGLMLAVTRAMKNSGLTAEQIDFISAHGTATPYNDEMESKAFSAAGLCHVPLNSLKGYFGHTLGAAGIIESAIAIQGMKQNILFKTMGYSELGVTEKISVVDRLTEKTQKYIVKTASGFGGCNAAVILEKL